MTHTWYLHLFPHTLGHTRLHYNQLRFRQLSRGRCLLRLSHGELQSLLLEALLVLNCNCLREAPLFLDVQRFDGFQVICGFAHDFLTFIF